MRKVLLSLWIAAALSLLLSISGCTIGVKEKERIIYVSFAKTPEELKGALRIATSDPIPVTVVGEEETAAELSLGGYYVVHENDLRAFIKAINERPR